MPRYLHPLQFLLTLIAGWIHRRQLDAIEYLKEENRFLKERLGGRRIRFTEDMTGGLTNRPGGTGTVQHSAQKQSFVSRSIIDLASRLADHEAALKGRLSSGPLVPRYLRHDHRSAHA